MKPLELLLFALIGFASVQAGEPSTDMGIEVKVVPEGVTLPGTEGTFSITITNYGPESDGGFFRWLPTGSTKEFLWPPLEGNGLFEGPCGISPVGQPPPGDNFGFWVTPILQPGESVTCTYGFRVADSTPLKQFARWDVAPFGLLQDPNESNNVAEALFTFSPQAIAQPVPAGSRLSLVVLLLLIAGVAVRRLN